MTRDYSQPVSDKVIATAKKALESHNFKVEIVDNLQEARNKVLSIIPEGSEVFTGTSVTLEKTGLAEKLNESGKYVSVRDKLMPLFGQQDKVIEMHRIGSGSDYAVGSVHAITEDGQVMVASASGSQLPNYVYGANHVIWVVGTQKIVKDVNEGFDRIENYTFHLEDERALKAYGAHSLISKLLIYREERNPERVTIILVKEPVGF